MEITLILHTANGDVRTAYQSNQLELLYQDIAEYIKEKKMFTVEGR